MRVDPLLEPIFAGYDFGPGESVEQDRASERATSEAIIGRLTLAVPDTVTIADIVIPGDVARPARIYTPTGTRTRAAFVFAHGGGWRTGSPATANEHCGWLAAEADVVVVSVDYRLVPEHPFPAGLDDVYRALEWTHESAAELGIDPARIAIGGESAGANLAAAAAIRARDEGGPSIALQLLEVPVLDLGDDHAETVAEISEAIPTFTISVDDLRRHYLTAGVSASNPLVSPLLVEDAAGLPPLLALAAEVDPVRDDAERYAARLRAAGVPARFRVFDGLVHGTESFTALLASAREWQRECVSALTAI
jgi:acetyl esterase